MTAVRPMRIVPDWQLLRPLHSSLISHVSSLGSGHFAFQGPSRAPAAPASSAAPKPGVGRLFSSDVSDPVAYSKELEAKVEGVKALFEDLKLPQDVEVFPSPPTGYRLRAEFAVHHDGPECHYVMFDTSKSRKDPERVRVDTFPLASRLINELMPLVTGFVNQNEVLRKKLFGVNFHTTLSGQAMVTLLYHRRLDDGWTEQAGALRQHLASAPSLAPPLPVLIGRSRGQIVELDCSHVIEKLHVNGRDFTYRQNEGAFSQPNGVVCQHMLSWAQRVTAGSPGDLLELYCGNGNFTLPLAQNFASVVATEISKSSVDAARYNLEANGVGNVFVGRLSAEEFTETWRAKGTRRRLAGLKPWDQLDFSTLLVDPPRAGLDAFTAQLLADFPRVLYVSCNPATLRDNLAGVVGATHRVSHFALFDQFPATHHVECGVLLTPM